MACDLWTRRRVGPDTATVLYSGTKGVAATALLTARRGGVLDLDAPVAALWPEFAAAGKAAITVATLLAHAAGLPAVERPLQRADLADPRALAAALAGPGADAPAGASRPTTRSPGAGSPASWRCGPTGGTLGAIVRERLAGPLGLDLQLGAARGRPAGRSALVRPRPALGIPSDGVHGRRARPAARARLREPAVRNRFLGRSRSARDRGSRGERRRDRAGDGDCSTARSPAARVLRPETVARGLAARAQRAPIALTGRLLRYGPSGYELAGTPSELGPAADAFGHTGAGGGSHGAWPALRTGFSFLPADLRSQDADRRAADVLAALHGVVRGVSGAAPEHRVRDGRPAGRVVPALLRAPGRPRART